MKILVLRFSSIGDIVLTTPVVRALHLQLGAEVHFLTKDAFATLLSPNPYLHRVHGFQKEVTEVLAVLKKERFDHVVDLHRNLRSLRVRLALGRPSSSFPKLNASKWLLVHTGIDLLPRVHIVDRYFRAAAPLGVVNDGRGLDHFIPENEEVRLESLDVQLAPGGYTAFALGANHATKQLPEDRMLEICRASGRPVVLLGGRAEQPLGERLAATGGPHVVNACGRLSLHQSASVIRQSAAVITHDTGMMHVAAALRKDIVSVWGNTVPAFGMTPYMPEGQGGHTLFEIPGLSCRPCSKLGYPKCPRGHFRCMRDHDAAAIAAAAEIKK